MEDAYECLDIMEDFIKHLADVHGSKFKGSPALDTISKVCVGFLFYVRIDEKNIMQQ